MTCCVELGVACVTYGGGLCENMLGSGDCMV